LELTPISTLWQAVKAQTGPARRWHVDDLLDHESRYLCDLSMIAHLAPAGGTVLEIGAAPCHMTALLTLNGYSAVGVDINPERVRDLIDRFALDVRRCDIERSPLPFPDETFACAMLCETLEHLRIDPPFVLSELNRVLKLGAALFLTTPNVYSLPSLGRFLMGRSIADPVEEFGKLRRLGHMGHIREYSAIEVARLLGGSGFGIQTIDYRYHTNRSGRKAKLLYLAYRIVPRRLRREIVIVARKVEPGPRLEPLPTA
jgi:SAM-dependent methyltransferase